MAGLLRGASDGEVKFRTLLETAPVAIVAINHRGQIELVNARMEELFGYRSDELIGQPLEILLPPALRTMHAAHRNTYFGEPHVRPMGVGLDLRGQHKDGREFPVEIALSYLTTEKSTLAIGFITDVTEQRAMQAALEQHALQLEQRVAARTYEIGRQRAVAEGLREILGVLNSDRSLDEILAYLVELAAGLLDTPATALYRLERDSDRLIMEAYHGLPDSYVAQDKATLGEGPVGRAVLDNAPMMISDIVAFAAEGGRSTTYQQRLAALGARFSALLAVPLVVKGESYGSLVLYHTQPRTWSEEEIALAVAFADQAALAIENARLRAQVEQNAVAAERTRLARDLHDAVTQTLFSASLIAEVLPTLWTRRPEEGVRRLEELRQLTRGALAEMRTLLYELRPAVLTRTTLDDLLRQLAEATTGRARVPITVQVAGTGPLPPDTQVALYRIAQEALNNVAKHAVASQVEVSLRRTDGSSGIGIILEIRDDGRGFDPQQVMPQRLGLAIMQERADAIGARLSIDSTPGQGTTIVVEWRSGEETP